MSEENLKCPYCGLRRCSTSHFRLSDLPYLLLLRLPVRCHSCQERFYVNYLRVLRMMHGQRSRSYLIQQAELSRQEDPVTTMEEGAVSRR